ncbi:MAG: poly-gamma-glutamate synthase PgsB [Deltaproteobacteria bacterium]|nr:poly-gamma-glutamate synthase PgsB [Deltaproteobacteria bacterium]
MAYGLIGAEVIAISAALLLAALLAEALHHARRLASIAVRIHVNGTRGKSSVTRLIAAGLRAGGRRCFAKTTGTAPRFILPDGREVPVYRPARPNVIEQRHIVASAAAQHAEVLVVECMAVQPELQALSELRLIRSTHGVITNVRPDHLEVMGPTERDVALAIAATVPCNGTLFTTETRHLAVLQEAARDRGTALVPVDGDAVARVTAQEMAGFAYHEHAENVALALAVCESFGVDRANALRGMCEARPDPGVLVEHRLQFFGRHIVFVNAMAANDPVSTEGIWRTTLERHPGVGRRIALFNCRGDRTVRSAQLARAYRDWPQAEHVVLTGDGTHAFARTAERVGVDPLSLIDTEGADVEELFETLIALARHSALIVAMGNIGGIGLRLNEYFANRAEPT